MLIFDHFLNILYCFIKEVYYMKFVIMDLDDFIFGNEEWHESER